MVLNKSQAKLTLFSSLWLILIILTNNTITAKAFELAQVNPIPPQDINPPDPNTFPSPEIPERPVPPPENLLPSEEEELEVPIGSIFVKYFVFEFQTPSTTQITAEELGKIEIELDQSKIAIAIAEIENQRLTFNQLLQIVEQVQEYYAKAGYRTSGATIDLGMKPKEITPDTETVVTITIIEGILENIRVIEEGKEGEENEAGKLGNYVRQRLKVNEGEILNVDNLENALRLLQIDPLVDGLSAQLFQGSGVGQSILIVTYNPGQTFNPQIFLNNSRSPSVGTFERGIELRENNLLGFGDSILARYSNTDGSNRVDAGYLLPINSQNGTVGFNFSWTENRVIEPPFDDIDGDGNSPDITSETFSYEISLRQPIIRTIQNLTFREFSLGLTSSLRESQSFLFDTPFPLSPGANEDGLTRIFALRFSQDYVQQSANDVLAFRSEFSFGLDAFNSTINTQVPGAEEIPDSRFFIWRGQGQYVLLFGSNALFLIRSNIQLADRTLVPMEQFSIGGFNSVRGYRQDQLLTDNGFFISTEVRIPIFQVFNRTGVIQLIPFIDYGIGWNTGGINPETNNLASTGVGLQWQQGDYLLLRLEYGIPLIDVDSRNRTWQESGIYFNIQYTP